MERTTRALGELLEGVTALRAPDGCPWDRKQTLADMSRYILEEVCEVQDAIADSDGLPTEAVCEELGDVLMNVFLSSVIAAETDAFSLADVADGIREKLVRRHPHVFGDVKVDDVDGVLEQWNAIKAEEKRHREDGNPAGRASPSLLDDVPRGLPPLARAYEATRKAAGVGFDAADPDGFIDKLEEEIGELRELLECDGDRADAARVQEELGDVLFSAVNLCRKLDHRPDDALRRSTRKFSDRFREIERRLGDLHGATLEQMDAVWNDLRSRRK